MIAAKLKNDMRMLGEIVILTKDTIACTFSRPFYWGRLLEQIVQLGIGSLSITIVIGIDPLQNTVGPNVIEYCITEKQDCSAVGVI
jgi:ABC-type transporter Mla maintaining outer membrane lipid asymmetry permease subunit MlaE